MLPDLPFRELRHEIDYSAGCALGAALLICGTLQAQLDRVARKIRL